MAYGVDGTAASTVLNLTQGTTVVKPYPGRLFGVTVATSGSGAGTINDCNVSGNVSPGTTLVAVPSGAQTYFFPGGIPLQFGLTVVVPTGAVYAVIYS